MKIQSAMVQFPVNDKNGSGYLALPEEGGPGILVLHAWWGLKPFFKQLCDRLAEQGFVAFAPDLNRGEIADTIEAAMELMRKRDNQSTGDTVRAAKSYLLANSSRKGKEIGVMGFSMGAAWALAACAFSPEKLAAAVLFYGAGEADYSKVRVKIQGHYAENDEWEADEYIQAMEKDMLAAGLEVTFYTYPKTKHWFMEEDRPEYDPQAAKLAWERALEFFKKNVK